MQGTVWAEARRQETEFGESWDWPGWSSPAREPGRQLGFGAEGGGLELEWKGDSAPSGWLTLSLLSGDGPESWVPQLALGSETLYREVTDPILRENIRRGNLPRGEEKT